MSEVVELSADQIMLNEQLHEFLLESGIQARDGDPQAYMEFVRFEPEDNKKGVMLRLRYVALANGGVKEEGAVFPRFSLTAAAAIQGYLESLSWYVGGMKNILWRQRPEVRELDGKWVVYSRLAAYT